MKATDQLILKPKALSEGATLGVFTPSSPGYRFNEELFKNGIKNLEALGFKVKLGSLTEKRSQQGYRSGSAEDRAKEFMDLLIDPQIDGLISTIGGSNSSSLIPFLDFNEIRKQQKLICGFSDVTSLHLAIIKFAGLRTIYGPSVMCWFGDWPNGVTESSSWFLEATVKHKHGSREVLPPTKWSNHARRWDNGDWKNITREWKTNEGWNVLNAGEVEAPIIALNLNTLVSAAGTPYWPDLSNKILLIEDMEAPMSRTERHLRHLQFLGVYDQIAGLIIGKPEVFKHEDAPFTYDELLMEVIGKRRYPIVSNFDCSHCVPMISIPQLTSAKLIGHADGRAEFRFLDGGVA